MSKLDTERKEVNATVKSLDLIEAEKVTQEKAKELLSGIHPSTDPDQQAEAQTEDTPSERLFTKAEVDLMISDRVAQERAGLECREYLLTHYYGLNPQLSAEIDSVLRVLAPRNVDELTAKLGEIEALGDLGSQVIHHAGPVTSRSFTQSLRQIFGV